MPLDRGVSAVSPGTEYRMLRAAGRWDRSDRERSRKGAGFDQPLAPHAHRHVDVTYVNVIGASYHLCSIVDGCSRVVAHNEIRERMTEQYVEVILQGTRGRYPNARLRVVPANGPSSSRGTSR